MVRRALRLIVIVALSAIVVAGIAWGALALWFDGPPVARARRDDGRGTGVGQHRFGRTRSTPPERACSCAVARGCRCCLVGIDSPEQNPRLVPRCRSHGARSFSRVVRDDPEREELSSTDPNPTTISVGTRGLTTSTGFAASTCSCRFGGRPKSRIRSPVGNSTMANTSRSRSRHARRRANHIRRFAASFASMNSIT